MSSEVDMMERQARLLAGLSEKAYELACELQARAMAAENAAEQTAYARAFHEVARSVRQTLALEMRLRREAKRAEREAADEARAQARTLTDERKAQVRHAVRTLLWTEYEAEDADLAEVNLRRWAEEAAEDPDFLTATVETVVERLKGRVDAAVAELHADDDLPWSPPAARAPALHPSG